MTPPLAPHSESPSCDINFQHKDQTIEMQACYGRSTGIVLLTLLLATAAVGCKRDKDSKGDSDTSAESNTVSLKDDSATSPPNSSLRHAPQEAWQRATKEDTLEGYWEFGQAHPQSPHVVEAHQLEELRAWERAQSFFSIDAVDTFRERYDTHYPPSPHSQQTKHLREDAKWQVELLNWGSIHLEGKSRFRVEVDLVRNYAGNFPSLPSYRELTPENTSVDLGVAETSPLFGHRVVRCSEGVLIENQGKLAYQHADDGRPDDSTAFITNGGQDEAGYLLRLSMSNRRRIRLALIFDCEAEDVTSLNLLGRKLSRSDIGIVSSMRRDGRFLSTDRQLFDPREIGGRWRIDPNALVQWGDILRTNSSCKTFVIRFHDPFQNSDERTTATVVAGPRMVIPEGIRPASPNLSYGVNGPLELASEGMLPFYLLARLDRLEELRIENCPYLNDLSPMALVPSLQVLHVESCHSLIDLRPLMKMKRLRVLRLRKNGHLGHMEPLAQCHTLRALDLMGAYTPNLRFLESLTNLTELDLSYCGSSAAFDIKPLEALRKLRGLDLTGTSCHQSLNSLELGSDLAYLGLPPNTND